MNDSKEIYKIFQDKKTESDSAIPPEFLIKPLTLDEINEKYGTDETDEIFNNTKSIKKTILLETDIEKEIFGNIDTIKNSLHKPEQEIVIENLKEKTENKKLEKEQINTQPNNDSSKKKKEFIDMNIIEDYRPVYHTRHVYSPVLFRPASSITSTPEFKIIVIECTFYRVVDFSSHKWEKPSSTLEYSAFNFVRSIGNKAPIHLYNLQSSETVKSNITRNQQNIHLTISNSPYCAYENLIKQYNGIVLLCDLSNKNALTDLEHHIRKIKDITNYSNKNFDDNFQNFKPMLIVGNINLKKDSVISDKALEDFADKNKCAGYIKVCMEDGTNCKKVFETLGRIIHDRKELEIFREEQNKSKNTIYSGLK